jgi:ubiquinone/menaquinone biosynthesis C-methylase UbiE
MKILRLFYEDARNPLRHIHSERIHKVPLDVKRYSVQERMNLPGLHQFPAHGTSGMRPQPTAAPTPDWESLSCCLVCGSEKIRAVDAEHNICQCGACGCVFDNPRPTLSALVSFYSKPAKYDSWLGAEAARQRLWKRRLKKLLKHASRGNLLDVGTGTGQFLNVAKPFFNHVTGTEVSQTALRIAKERYNLDIAQGQIEECELPRNSFDTITLFHVLEHVPDPRKTIARCSELLSIGGVLLVCVPNDVMAWTSKIKILGKKLGLRAFQKFSPRFGLPRAFSSREIHLSHFTAAVLRRGLERAGLSVIDESLDTYYVATGVWHVLHSAYYGLHRLLFALLGVNWYDTIWMVARKVPR